MLILLEADNNYHWNNPLQGIVFEHTAGMIPSFTLVPLFKSLSLV